MTHPMDSVPMPEPAGAMDKDAGPFMFLGEEIGRLTDAVNAYSEEQLRAERISAYEMGRNSGHKEGWKACLEEWAKHMKGMAEAIGVKK